MEQSYFEKQSARFTTAAITGKPTSNRVYLLEYAKKIVRSARTIGRASKLTGDALDTVVVAAWFYVIGIVDGTENHIERSLSAASIKLTAWGASRQLITDVLCCILATSRPMNPKTTMEMVFCDAVISAHPAYKIKTNRQHYFTQYGKEILSKRRISPSGILLYSNTASMQ